VKTPTLESIVRDLVRSEVAAASRTSFAWIHWKQWARSVRAARGVAAREGVRLTKIGRELFGHREDLDRLALTNAIEVVAPSTAARDEVERDLAAAFGGSR
jgi:hypothetical protein